MNHIASRYVSISGHYIPSPLYLCEVEVLSPAVSQIAQSQCGEEEGILVFNNMCLFINKEGKMMPFNEAENYCREKELSLPHQQLEEDAAVYKYVKYSSGTIRFKVQLD